MGCLPSSMNIDVASASAGVLLRNGRSRTSLEETLRMDTEDDSGDQCRTWTAAGDVIATFSSVEEERCVEGSAA